MITATLHLFYISDVTTDEEKVVSLGDWAFAKVPEVGEVIAGVCSEPTEFVKVTSLIHMPVPLDASIGPSVLLYVQPHHRSTE